MNEDPPELAPPPAGEDAPEPGQPPERRLFVALAIGALAALAVPTLLSAALGAAPRRGDQAVDATPTTTTPKRTASPESRAPIAEPQWEVIPLVPTSTPAAQPPPASAPAEPPPAATPEATQAPPQPTPSATVVPTPNPTSPPPTPAPTPVVTPPPPTLAPTTSATSGN